MALAFDANLGTVTNSGTLTTSAAAASGSRVFVFVWWFDATGTCTGASGGGLTWVVDHQYASTLAGNNHQAILSADAPSGLASSTNIVPTFSTSPDFGPGIAAVSFTGVETGASGYVDVVSADQENFNAAWTTENLVTTNADDLLIAFSYAPDATSNAATGSSTEIHDWLAEGTNRCCSEYRIVSSTSTYTLTGTWSSPAAQFNFAIAYKAAAAPPPLAAFPTTGILDDFNRANADPVSGNWTCPLALGEPNLEIVSNQLVGAGTGWFKTAFGRDQEVYIDMVSALGEGHVLWLFCRTANPGSPQLDGYAATIVNDDPGNITVGIQEFADASNSYIAGPEDEPFAAGDAVGFECRGSNLTVYRRSSGVWSSVITVSDSTYATGGFLSVWSTEGSFAMDNFGGGDIAVPLAWAAV